MSGTNQVRSPYCLHIEVLLRTIHVESSDRVLSPDSPASATIALLCHGRLEETIMVSHGKGHRVHFSVEDRE